MQEYRNTIENARGAGVDKETHATYSMRDMMGLHNAREKCRAILLFSIDVGFNQIPESHFIGRLNDLFSRIRSEFSDAIKFRLNGAVEKRVSFNNTTTAQSAYPSDFVNKTKSIFFNKEFIRS